MNKKFEKETWFVAVLGIKFNVAGTFLEVRCEHVFLEY